MPMPAQNASSQLITNGRKLESNYLAARTRSCGNSNAPERLSVILSIRPSGIGQNDAGRLHESSWENDSMPHHPSDDV